MFLGLDFGTSSVKGILINEDQKIFAVATATLKVSRPKPGYSEQDPEDWWKAANKVIRHIRALKPKALAAVEGIGLSGQQHGACLLDQNGKVLRPCILWNDSRSFLECDEIIKNIPEAINITGNMPFASFTAPKLLWVRKHEPKIFVRTAKVLLPKDYIRYRLTGQYASDLSDSAGTYWLDVTHRTWSDAILKATHMRHDQMPELFEGIQATGRLSPEVAKLWGMPLRPVVAGGAGDNVASSVGIGAIRNNAAFLSLGTSGVLFVANDQYKPNANKAIHTFCHAMPNHWHQMGVILSATASLDWLASLLGAPASKLIQTLGSNIKQPASLLFLPYLAGERTPVGDAKIRGAFLGLSPETDAKVMTQAVLEGVAFALRDSYEAFKSTGTKITRLTAVGGGTKSPLWLKIIASVLNVIIDVPKDSEVGAAFGAARLGLIAATGKDYTKICAMPKIAKSITPNPNLKTAYEAAYQRYQQIYPAIKNITIP